MKPTSLALVVGAVIIGASLVFIATRGSDSQQAAEPAIPVNNVAIVEGKQVIDISAKGGYNPVQSAAKAGIPTILRVSTKGTFDCSSAVRIPSMSISKNLPPSGTTDIDLGSPQLGTLQGTCGMGMYPFEITFTS